MTGLDTMGAKLIHATAVAMGGEALLLRGPSGAGKSDLAFRLLEMGASHPFDLVSDDQVRLEIRDNRLTASAPETILGLIEVRGLGLVRLASVERACVRLVIDLVPLAEVPRMPPDRDQISLLGINVPRLKLYAFEPSAPLKCARALRDACADAPKSSDP
jgi:HPr kinase/phosphorylase